MKRVAQEVRQKLAQAVWEAREGAPLPGNLFQTPLRAARDPEVEAVLGVYRAAHSLGFQLPRVVEAEEQDDREGLRWSPQERSSSSSSCSSSSGSTSSSSCSSSDSSCPSTPEDLKHDERCESETQEGIHGEEGGVSQCHSRDICPMVVEKEKEEKVTTSSEEAPGEAGDDGGVEGEDEQGEALVEPGGAAVRLPPRLTVQMIPGWILHGRKKKRNSRMKPDPGMQLVARNEFKAYQSKLVRRRNT